MSKKQFVKFTQFEDNHTPKTNSNKPKRRNYLQKNSKKTDGALLPMIDAYKTIHMTPRVEDLAKKFPKFFANTSRRPEKDLTENLNEFVVINTRKPQPQVSKAIEMVEESDDPDWDSDCEDDFTLESKKIDQEVINRAEKKFSNLPIKKMHDLRPHERDFIQEHIRRKAHQAQQKQPVQVKAESALKPVIEQSLKPQIKDNKPNNGKDQSKEIFGGDNSTPKKSNILDEWLNIDHKSQSGFWVQKIDNDDQFNDFDQQNDIPFDLDDEDRKESESSSDQDQAFVDEKPNVIHATKGPQTKEEAREGTSEHQGVVLINNHLFSNISQRIGLPPAGCIWVISNKEQRYKVSTDYMDQIYREHRICEHYPYISLNHSEFVHNNDVATQRGFDKLKRFNERKIRAQHKYQQIEDKRTSRPTQSNQPKKQYQPNPHKKR